MKMKANIPFIEVCCTVAAAVAPNPNGALMNVLFRQGEQFASDVGQFCGKLLNRAQGRSLDS
jgi:hypothetical protein